MTTDDHEKKWKELTGELRNFQEIARYLNPSSGEIPELPGIDIHGFSMPLRDVIGGDHTIYVDFNHRYDLDRRVAEAKSLDRPTVANQLERLRHRAGILVADVSGHQMTDALIGAMLHQAFLLGVYYELDLFGEITTRLFEQLNTRFFRTTAINKYFTMLYGEISDRGTFRFLSAGHHPPTVFSREYGHFVEISQDRLTSFPPVGMLPSTADPDDRANPSPYRHKRDYEVNEIDLLARGDTLLLHTDGLIEHAGGDYFPKRVEELLVSADAATSEEICTMLREDILSAATPEDDISVVVIRRDG